MLFLKLTFIRSVTLHLGAHTDDGEVEGVVVGQYRGEHQKGQCQNNESGATP